MLSAFTSFMWFRLLLMLNRRMRQSLHSWMQLNRQIHSMRSGELWIKTRTWMVPR